MPVLSDPKHEAFAQALANGKSQTDAYAIAGYKAHRQNASRLMTNDDVQARVKELQEKAAVKVVDTSAFEATALFQKMFTIIDKAIEAGDLKTAADAQMKVIRCFGYEDSPTLTHEHVKGQKVQVHDKPEGEQTEEPRAEASNVAHLADAINKLRKRAG